MTGTTPFLILLGGDLTPTQRIRRQIAGLRTIAADGGMRHAGVLGVEPELWVGDFDSSPPALAGDWSHVARQSHPAAKDATDGALAAEAAVARGADRLVIAGALGGERSDHALQNLLHGAALRARGLPVLLTSGHEEAWPLVPGEQMLDLPAGSLFSVLALSDLTGLTLEGVAWPLLDRDVPMGGSLTLSNRVAQGANGIRIHLGDGRAVLLSRPYDLEKA
jgi:thiamine pyrophosphokinase